MEACIVHIKEWGFFVVLCACEGSYAGSRELLS